ELSKFIEIEAMKTAYLENENHLEFLRLYKNYLELTKSFAKYDTQRIDEYIENVEEEMEEKE
ncbi:6530_t:CDS:2, partial [Cetraspora pellucida]